MYLKVDFILFSWYSKNKAREWWCFIKIQIEKWSFYPWHDTLPLFWKSIQWDTHASQINTGQVIHGIINMLWCLLTWSHVCFRPLLDFLTQSSSGILQDPCVCFWSSILHHHITAPSTGYQLCEPPPEPQRVLTSNRRKGKRKKNVKKSLISFYWFCPDYNIMPDGVYVMVLDLGKASGAKGKQMGEDKNGRLAPK